MNLAPGCGVDIERARLPQRAGRAPSGPGVASVAPAAVAVVGSVFVPGYEASTMSARPAHQLQALRLQTVIATPRTPTDRAPRAYVAPAGNGDQLRHQVVTNHGRQRIMYWVRGRHRSGQVSALAACAATVNGDRHAGQRRGPQLIERRAHTSRWPRRPVDALGRYRPMSPAAEPVLRTRGRHRSGQSSTSCSRPGRCRRSRWPAARRQLAASKASASAASSRCSATPAPIAVAGCESGPWVCGPE